MLLDTPQRDVGSKVPNFNLPTAQGELYNDEILMGEHGLLLAFICNHCPYVKAQVERLVTDTIILQEAGIGVAFIMSNDFAEYPADAPDKMALFAETHGFTAPYLIDEDQSLARACRAVCTPDFFGYDATGALQYRGRLDNLGMRGDSVGRVAELRDAMQLIASTGAGPEEQLPSMGCSIKWR